MLRLGKKSVSAERTPDTLEVVHHEIPDTAAGAGAPAIPARAYRDGGITWRMMMQATAVAEVVGFGALLVGLAVYGTGTFGPAIVAAVLFAVAAVWIPRMTKASTIYSLVVSSLTLLLFGGLFFGWTGYLHITSWFEVTFATASTVVPIAGIVAATATLRHHDGDNAAKTPAMVTGIVCAALVLVGVVGSVASSDATRLPGDVTVAAQNFKFEQTAITAKAGDVAIYFENKDPFAHNVAIRGHGASSDANGGQSIRHVFKSLPAGSYEYYCTIHPDEMKGTLTVT